METRILILSGFLLAFVPAASLAQKAAALPAEPVFLDDVSTVAETSALIASINRFRADAGLAALAEDGRLSEWAAGVFPEAVAARGAVDVTVVRKSFGADDVRVLRGVVTHRGARSGAEFSKHWAQDPQWKAVMAGDFTHIGAYTRKRSDGKLVAFAYLIKR